MLLCSTALLLKVALILTCAGQQQQCSVDRLPVFGTTNTRAIPDFDRFQAIVPAYTFQCSGRVTEWRACVQPGGFSDERYYIQFQVWRPTGIDGCYDLVGYNTPLDDEDSEEFLSPPGDSGDPLHRCVVLPVRESQQIEFQAGDVIGYYVDHFRYNRDQNGGGIQWIENEDVVVYYRDNLPREDIKSQYAIDITNIDPSVCGFPTETSDLHSLSTVASSAPIISISIGKYYCNLAI